jgi:hypothetical protein
MGSWLQKLSVQHHQLYSQSPFASSLIGVGIVESGMFGEYRVGPSSYEVLTHGMGFEIHSFGLQKA